MHRPRFLQFRPLLTMAALILLMPAVGAGDGSEWSLDGMIDLHVHTAPDTGPRLMDDVEAARAARDAGMRAIVLKNHEFQTAARAELASRAVPGIEVFGGIALKNVADRALLSAGRLLGLGIVGRVENHFST